MFWKGNDLVTIDSLSLPPFVISSSPSFEKMELGEREIEERKSSMSVGWEGAVNDEEGSDCSKCCRVPMSSSSEG